MQTVSLLITLLIAIAVIPFIQTTWAQEADVITPSASFRNLRSEEISNSLEGHPLMLNFDVHNNQNQTRSGVVVFEVRDSNEFTVYLGWQSVNVGANGNSSMAVSWVPSDDGRYVIRTFALQGLEGDEVKSWSAIYESRRLNVE